MTHPSDAGLEHFYFDEMEPDGVTLRIERRALAGSQAEAERHLREFLPADAALVFTRSVPVGAPDTERSAPRRR